MELHCQRMVLEALIHSGLPPDHFRIKPGLGERVTRWLNLGDSYSARGGTPTGLHTYLGHHLGAHRAAGVPAKNLLCLPWRVAFALQEDGWILRNAIVRHKPNAMPESVRDRLNCRHELIFLFVKQAVLLVRPGPDPHPARHYPAGAYRAARPERPGSGTTGLAARQLGRRFTGIELSPAFAALAAERLREAIRPEDHGGPP